MNSLEDMSQHYATDLSFLALKRKLPDFVLGKSGDFYDTIKMQAGVDGEAPLVRLRGIAGPTCAPGLHGNWSLENEQYKSRCLVSFNMSDMPEGVQEDIEAIHDALCEKLQNQVVKFNEKGNGSSMNTRKLVKFAFNDSIVALTRLTPKQYQAYKSYGGNRADFPHEIPVDFLSVGGTKKIFPDMRPKLIDMTGLAPTRLPEVPPRRGEPHSIKPGDYIQVNCSLLAYQEKWGDKGWKLMLRWVPISVGLICRKEDLITAPVLKSEDDEKTLVQPSKKQRTAKFCCECGFKYQKATEKFCSECGTKRFCYTAFRILFCE
ncbi:MAG: hypothetical protein SGCHY_000462 [Lobulomycetales sp.]